MRNLLIYTLQDPITYEIRYIGKSANGLQRPKAHIYHTDLKTSKTYKSNWIRSLINNGLKPVIKVVQYLNNLNELNRAEQYWIQYFKQLGCPLTNATNGGMGRCGLPHTEETKQKIREGQKNKKIVRGKDHGMYGRKRTDKEKQLISERTKEKMQSSDVIEKMKNRCHYKKIVDQNGIEYYSIEEAVRQTNLDKGTIRRILSGKTKQCKGYSFKEVN